MKIREHFPYLCIWFARGLEFLHAGDGRNRRQLRKLGEGRLCRNQPANGLSSRIGLKRQTLSLYMVFHSGLRVQRPPGKKFVTEYRLREGCTETPQAFFMSIDRMHKKFYSFVKCFFLSWKQISEMYLFHEYFRLKLEIFKWKNSYNRFEPIARSMKIQQVESTLTQ